MTPAFLRAIAVLAFVTLCAAAGESGKGEPGKGKAKHTNRLAKETSPYLLMHAHNPTDWYAWARRRLRKPAPRTSRSSFPSATPPAIGAT